MNRAVREWNFLLEFFFKPIASVTLLIGEWKSGKTDFALYLAETLLKKGIVKKVASNIKTKSNLIEYIDNVPHLNAWMHYDHQSKLYIFDEGGRHLHKRRSMSKKNVEIVSLLPEISKGRCKWLVLYQNPNAIDGELNQNSPYCRGTIYKINRKTAKFISPHLPGSKKAYVIRNIPRTSIPFDQWDQASMNEVNTLPNMYYNDVDKNILWKWIFEKKSTKALGLHPQQMNRIIRRYIEQHMLNEKEVNQQTNPIPQ